MNGTDCVDDLRDALRRDSADTAELMATQVYQSKSTESHRQCADLIFQSCKSLNLSVVCHTFEASCDATYYAILGALLDGCWHSISVSSSALEALWR